MSTASARTSAQRAPDTWKRKFNGLQSQGVLRLKELEQENLQLKRLLAERDLEIDTVRSLARKTAGRFRAGFGSAVFEGVGRHSTMGLPHHEPVDLDALLHPSPDRNGALRECLRAVARLDIGYRLARALLLPQFGVLNPKHIYRLWKQERLALKKHTRKRHSGAKVPLSPQVLTQYGASTSGTTPA